MRLGFIQHAQLPGRLGDRQPDGGDPVTSQPAAVSPARDQWARPLVVALSGGCAVALALGLYARLHHPARYALDVAGFSSPLYAKAWLTTAAVVFAVVQVLTGWRIYRQPAAPAPAWPARSRCRAR